ncbi:MULTISPECIES: twin-arginine translocase TatA/TatE family subunit [Hymenobacter]|uniref:Sec-independent protein translocase protein TatA n=1 Tax=Hymenobacter jejuensis TaxID=2502781 RepID=A0A5B8A0J1_9BACT|nr:MULTISPECIES: twin-arginine translocase TatA/TatE family subunit [Hymenobacter]MBC6990995.1 twin-arginine translocase TatA/TatE family subunit [Hymenobacter sp. BT491]QDA60607.1 twin-arginine translocase TatA/TatE family subunit [Hymenobacter jejuensis]
MNMPVLLFLGDIGGSELLLIMVVILMFFGANKIPELARGLGKGIREFKDASREIRSEIENSGQPQPTQYQNQFNNNTGYQAPQQPVYQAPVAQPEGTHAPVTPIAPPMDGGITPPVADSPRLDQTTN